jgi:nucleotide-binding universal stress UspA family protein
VSTPIQTIVAGVSQPSDDDPTLAAAAELARRTGARLHVVLAFTIPATFGPPEYGYAYTQWLPQYTENLRTRLEKASHRVPGAESAVCHAIAGAAGPAILDVAQSARADLLIVGAARPGRLLSPFLGTTAQRVLRGASVPVLVVRRRVRTPLRRVLFTTDLSELSAAVHEQGLDTVAALFGDPMAVRSLLVVSNLVIPPPLPEAALAAAARGELDAFLHARRERVRSVEPVVRFGAPDAVIAAEAEDWDADLLVVGTHARDWAGRMMLGSVAETSLRDAPCNVLAIPPRAAALEPSRNAAPAAEGADPQALVTAS